MHTLGNRVSFWLEQRKLSVGKEAREGGRAQLLRVLYAKVKGL